MDIQTYYASKKRLFLSWYIDFILFMTLWYLISYFLGLEDNLPFWAPYSVFIIIRTILEKIFGSIGYFFLSIDKDTKEVDPNVYERENWLTMLFGTLLVLEGGKQLIRWTETLLPQPFFGHIPNETIQIGIYLLFGFAYILAGYWFFKVNIKGFYLTILLIMTNIISIVLSWNLWSVFVEKMVLARRNMQDLPVREGEIEFLQIFFPKGILAIEIFLFIALLFTYKRFR
ncbi:MAG: hypothetical protein GXO12_03960 [Epsilonproteobacteria bacterium]|nr:hypothetical protein [Campylobacterota bacterium]